jgi:hypothetical protein
LQLFFIILSLAFLKLGAQTCKVWVLYLALSHVLFGFSLASKAYVKVLSLALLSKACVKVLGADFLSIPL